MGRVTLTVNGINQIGLFGSLNENAHLRVTCLGIGSPVRGTVKEGLGGKVLLEKMGHWGCGNWI